MTNRVTSYVKKLVSTNDVIDEIPLPLPPVTLETKAVWWTLPAALIDRAAIDARRLPGAIHAAEHCAIGMLPLVATCDRWDIGGVSTPLHQDTGLTTIFVYDGYPGGAGVTERGFRDASGGSRRRRSGSGSARARAGARRASSRRNAATATSPSTRRPRRRSSLRYSAGHGDDDDRPSRSRPIAPNGAGRPASMSTRGTPYVAVIGASNATEWELETAERIGSLLAEAGAVLVCGGLGGVMDAAARGCEAAGGTSIGILPGDDRALASPHLTVAVATGFGEARNAIVARSADAVIAVGGEFGTLSEVALALKMGTPVVGLGTWELGRDDLEHDPIVRADTPDEAIAELQRLVPTFGP